jgi:hypothetical protein
MARPSVPHRGDPVSNRKPGSKIAEQTAGQRMQAVGGQSLNDKTQVQVIARAAAILHALEDEAAACAACAVRSWRR